MRQYKPEGDLGEGSLSSLIPQETDIDMSLHKVRSYTRF